MQSKPFTPIETAILQFNEYGEPYSPIFDDIYFAKGHGLEESNYVFVEGNHLPERFAKLETEDFVIAELGFGTGLNLITSIETWHTHHRGNGHLYFYSFEKYPLSKEDLEKVATLFPNQLTLFNALLAAYPLLIPGLHQVKILSNVTLCLWLGDAVDGLQQLCIHNGSYQQSHSTLIVDAWYFDGFAPKNNPTLWDQDLVSLVRHLSKEGTTLATFSVARTVKEALTLHDFRLQKRKGFGHKRDMLTAHLEKDEIAPTKVVNTTMPATPWFLSKPQYTVKNVAIIGCGLAGCHMANRLAHAGLSVTVIDQSSGPATGASGNPQGILNLKPSPFHSPWADFWLLAFLHASRFYQTLGFGAPMGMIKLAHSEKETVLQSKLADLCEAYPELMQLINEKKISELSGIPSQYQSGLYFPLATVLQPAKICVELLQHDAIKTLYNTAVSNIEPSNGGWKIAGQKYDTVIIACGHQSNHFSQTATLPIKGIPGEISAFPPNDTTEKLKLPLCADGYVAPAMGQQQTVGASYQVGNRHQLAPNIENHQRLTQFFKEAHHQISLTEMQGRISIRATTPDYMPMVGPVPVIEAFKNTYGFLRKDANADIRQVGEFYPNLYLLAGLGSQGLSYAPLSADFLAAQILGKPLPLPGSFLPYLSPARFLIRDIKRGLTN